jgi:hydrogenase expression/formation protein HypE
MIAERKQGMDVPVAALNHCTPQLIRAVVFDFDGTLTAPSDLSLLPVKKRLGCPPDAPLLEHIASLKTVTDLTSAHRLLAEHEMTAACLATPNASAQEVVAYLRSKGVLTAILTRNHRAAITRALENFERLGMDDFDVILTRDEMPLPKPGPDGVWQVTRLLGVDVKEILMVGDFVFDIQAGLEAGAYTVLLDSGGDPSQAGIAADLRIENLDQLIPLIDLTRPLPMGKFPNRWLSHFFQHKKNRDPSIIVAPGVGDDTAAVDVGGEDILVLKSDPITFSTDDMGYYAVLINANDLATSGATPRWFMATLLFPVGWSAAQILNVLGQLEQVCDRWQITLCGGHTELTDAVTRPVICGMLTGTVAPEKLIKKTNIRSGDRVFITKTVGLEGGAIIASTHRQQLLAAGLTTREIDHLHRFDELLSILPEARVAAQNPAVSAMHDVTEGGVATALEELCVSGGCRMQIHMEKIPIHPLVQKMARKMRLNPLGLIGSGALIICCRPGRCADLLAQMAMADLPIAEIGTVIEGKCGVDARRGGKPVDWPKFDADELTRLY